MRKIIAAAIVATGFAMTAGPASALNPFGSTDFSLSADDIQALGAAQAKLLRDDAAKPGDTATWVAPKSGNNGIVTLRRIYTENGQTCKELNSAISIKRTDIARSYLIDACLQSDGNWKAPAL